MRTYCTCYKDNLDIKDQPTTVEPFHQLILIEQLPLVCTFSLACYYVFSELKYQYCTEDPRFIQVLVYRMEQDMF